MVSMRRSQTRDVGRDGTHRMRRMRRMVSPLPTSFSFSCCFSFFLFLIVPRFRCWYTLFARFFMDGAERRLCCIIRTHSSMSASLENIGGERYVRPDNARYGHVNSRVPVIVQPDGQDVAILLVLQRLQGYGAFTARMEVIPEEL